MKDITRIRKGIVLENTPGTDVVQRFTFFLFRLLTYGPPGGATGPADRSRYGNYSPGAAPAPGRCVAHWQVRLLRKGFSGT